MFCLGLGFSQFSTTLLIRKRGHSVLPSFLSPFPSFFLSPNIVAHLKQKGEGGRKRTQWGREGGRDTLSFFSFLGPRIRTYTQTGGRTQCGKKCPLAHFVRPSRNGASLTPFPLLHLFFSGRGECPWRHTVAGERAGKRCLN